MIVFIFLLSTVLSFSGFNIEGVVGVRTDEEGNGRIIYDTKYEVDDYYNYIGYESGDVGEEIGTIFILGNSGEPDDILFRKDF